MGTANGWPEQQFFYQRNLLWRNAGTSAYQLQAVILKSDKI